MDIDTREMEALLRLRERQTQMPRKGATNSSNFEALLNEQLAGDQNAHASSGAAGAAIAQPLMCSQLLMRNMDLNARGGGNVAELRSAFDQTSGALDMWDEYASLLGGSTSDSVLRDAYSLLEGIDSRVSLLKNNAVIGGDTELNGIVNELDVMTGIEKFKFGRGDYSA